MAVPTPAYPEFGADEQYWRRQLAVEETRHTFPVDFSGTGKPAGFETRQYALDRHLSDSLLRVSKASPLHLLMLLITGVEVLLYKYTGDGRVRLNTTPFRPGGKTSPATGVYPVSNRVDAGQSLKELLLDVQKTLAEANEHFRYPVQDLVAKLLPDSRTYYAAPVVLLESIQYALPRHAEWYNLAFLFAQTGEGLACTVRFHAGRYHPATVERLAGKISEVLQLLVADPHTLVGAVNLVSASEKEVIGRQAAHPVPAAAEAVTLNGLISRWAVQLPDAVAIAGAGTACTYGQLEARANALAECLRSRQVTRNTPVGILLPPSADLVVAMLGIVRAGGAYLPIDPVCPYDRKKFILEDSRLEYLVSDDDLIFGHMELLQGFALDRLVDINDPDLPEAPGAATREDPASDDLAYIHYLPAGPADATGVAVQHGGLLNYLQWAIDRYAGSEKCVCPLFTHDPHHLVMASVWLPLMTGGTVRVYREEGGEPLIDKVFRDDAVTLVMLTPAHLRQVRARQLRAPGIQCIVAVGGQPLPFALAREVHAMYAGAVELFNEYGWAGAAGGCTTYRFDPADERAESVLLGGPAPNCRVCLLDENGRPVPYGALGQIYVGGVQVARQYGNGLPQERTPLNDPFTPGGLLHGTGDLARQYEDGNLAHAGRCDDGAMADGLRADRTTGGNEPPPVGTGEAAPEAETEKEAPATPLQEKLVEIWSRVLATDKQNIGINDNFFRVGGHSLKAMSLTHALHKQLNVQVTVGCLFEYPTVKELATYLETAGKTQYQAITPAPVQAFYPVTSAQQRMYILHQLDPESTTYNVSSAVELEGPLDEQRLQACLQALLARHESLRTSFELVEGQPVQKIHPDLPLPIDALQVQPRQLAQCLAALVRPFRLEQAPLLRVSLLKTAAHRQVLFTDMHHIICDGVSANLLNEEFVRLYRGEALPPLRLQYRDYALWQLGQRQSPAFARQQAYWLSQLALPLPVVELPTDFARPARASFAGRVVRFSTGKALKEGLQQLSRRYQSTLYMNLLAAYSVLLYKYTGQQDLLIGSPVAGRSHPDVEPLMGMFVNTIVLRNRIEGSLSFGALLGQVRENALQAFSHQHYPFEELVDKLGLSRQAGRNPLFEVMLVVQNTTPLPAPAQAATQAADQTAAQAADQAWAQLSARACPLERAVAKFELTLTAAETPHDIELELEYRSELFRPQTIERMAVHLLRILEQVSAQPQLTLAQIALLDEDEREQVLEGFNPSPADYCRQATLVSLLEAQARRTPAQPALSWQGRQWSYQQLHQQANRLSHLLIARGVGPHSLVGICLERGPELVTALLAVLKAGAAYLPLDPAYPSQRLAYLLADAGASLVLTSTPQQHVLPAGQPVLLLDQQGEALAGQPEQAPGVAITPGQLAYVIYTSGSTGRPKGVMIQHDNVVNLVAHQSEYFGITEQDNILLFSNYCFDASVEQLFMALSRGAKLVVVPESLLREVSQLEALLEAEQVTHLHATPSYLEYITPAGYKGLKRVIAGGEVCKPQMAQRWSKYVTFYNEYGPTETTVTSVEYRYDPSRAEALPGLPIGKPLANLRAYVLDADDQLAPVGVYGELCLSGAQLARGYLNHPELTGRKFVDNPCKPGEKMYRTGDRVRWLPDGNLEYLGRFDHQVKVRGYRIETGEVENGLLSHRQVKEAVVVLREDKDDKLLCGYYTAEGELGAADLRTYLARRLPAYMIPANLVRVEKMPLTPTGKVDRQALPAPASAASGHPPVAPVKQTEFRLRSIWADLLGMDPEKIGVHDNFFEIGGNSLKIISLKSRILEGLAVDIPVVRLFEHANIAELSSLIDGQDAGGSGAYRQTLEAREKESLETLEQTLSLLQTD